MINLLVAADGPSSAREELPQLVELSDFFSLLMGLMPLLMILLFFLLMLRFIRGTSAPRGVLEEEPPEAAGTPKRLTADQKLDRKARREALKELGPDYKGFIDLE